LRWRPLCVGTYAFVAEVWNSTSTVLSNDRAMTVACAEILNSDAAP
jgi:hypothetical protein